MRSGYDDCDTKASKWDRVETAEKIIDFSSQKTKISQRKFAKENGIPRTTLQDWMNRFERIQSDPNLILFFESPTGQIFLHGLIHALHFEFTKVGCASIHNISNFIKLCGLSPFVAPSYGVHQKISDRMDELSGEFGDMERERLSKNMRPKRITLCEDETFHPEICLVGIEPVSNFIFVEQYAPDRTAGTWNEAVAGSLVDLPITVLQNSSDEGSGLINHTVQGLNAHHSPDLFHVQYEIGKGTSGPLAAKVGSAEKEHVKCAENLQKLKEKVPGIIGNDEKILLAQKKLNAADTSLNEARSIQEKVRKAKKEIGRIYHPFDPMTGNKQDARTISSLFEKQFDIIRQATDSFSDKCKKRIEKAGRVVPKMKSTIAFFFFTITSILGDLDLADDKRKLLQDQIIPGFYLQMVAEKEKNLDRKELIREKSKDQLAVLYDKQGPFSDCNARELEHLKRIAMDCAALFQRSSSCVEGRNAQLSLRHHGLHRLSEKKLKALTVIHNYNLKRPDGSTAAERLFEKKPIDMFEWLLENMEFAPRPRSTKKIAA